MFSADYFRLHADDKSKCEVFKNMKTHSDIIPISVICLQLSFKTFVQKGFTKILSLVLGMFALGSKDLVNVSNAVQRFHLQICLLQQKAFPHCQDTCISDPRDFVE